MVRAGQTLFQIDPAPFGPMPIRRGPHCRRPLPHGRGRGGRRSG
jgi:hypothetical protein